MVSGAGSILTPSQQERVNALQRTSRAIDEVQLRLASGLDVNSAIDDPLNFFTARSFGTQTARLQQLLDGINQGLRTIEEAQHGLEAIQKLLDTSEAFLREHPASGYVLHFDDVADFGSYSVIPQDSGLPVVLTDSGYGVVLDDNTWKKYQISYSFDENTVLEFDFRSTLQPEIAAVGFDNDDDYQNAGTQIFYLYGTQLGGIPTYAAPTATYAYDGSGEWVHVSIPLGEYFTGNFDRIVFIADDDGAGDDGDAQFRNIVIHGGEYHEGDDLRAISYEGLPEQYAALRQQIDDLITDANYRGVNLLADDNLETFFNGHLTSSLVTQGIDASSAGLGLGEVDFSRQSSIDAELENIREAREALRQYAASLATDYGILENRNDFTRGTINILKAAKDDLTVADQNEEGANMLALQTRQAIQSSVLALNESSILDILS